MPIESLDLAPVNLAPPWKKKKGGIKAVTSPATRMEKAEENETRRNILDKLDINAHVFRFDPT